MLNLKLICLNILISVSMCQVKNYDKVLPPEWVKVFEKEINQTIFEDKVRASGQIPWRFNYGGPKRGIPSTPKPTEEPGDDILGRGNVRSANRPSTNQACASGVFKVFQETMCGKPRKVLVEVPIPLEGDQYLPRAIELEQCVGVCGHFNMKCTPAKKEPVNVPVLIANFGPSSFSTGGGQFQSQCVSVKMERHLECQCSCPMTESDCNENQQFIAGLCRCECVNTNQAEVCLSQGRMWDNSSCICRCPPSQYRHCSTGYRFNDMDCKCVPE